MHAAPRAPLRWAAAISLLLLLSWIAAQPPIRDQVTLAAISGATLVRPAAYVVLAPLCDTMDALTLLSVSQTIALLGTLIALYVLWRVGRGIRRGTRPLRELRLALRALGALIAFYGVGILAPRPMAALRLADRDAVIVDVHSHTNYSHDGRADFSPRANRAWHRAAGFDAAYITDHNAFDGAAEAMRFNPRLAGDSIVMLMGLEFVMHDSHINALGVTPSTQRWLFVDRARAHPDWPPLATSEPVLIQTIPENLHHMPAPDSAGRHGVLGIELSDGAPRGIEQGERDRARILRLADSLDLALVAGSNNHGWGRTAVAWSVLRIPGWRLLAPDSLGRAIEARIRSGRRGAVQVIERRSPGPGRSRAALLATLPAVGWTMLTTLSPLERLSWFLWTSIIATLAWRHRVRRGRAPAR